VKNFLANDLENENIENSKRCMRIFIPKYLVDFKKVSKESKSY
jgi:hypothetical protein